MSRKLTHNDDIALLNFIHTFRKVNQYSPTVREIRDEYLLSSNSPVVNRINRLIELGYLERVKGIMRGIFITTKGYRALKEHERKVEESTDKSKNYSNVWET